MMELLLFIASGSRCTLVSMNKRRAGREMNNEDGELKLEAGTSVRVRVFNLLTDLRGILTLLFIRINSGALRHQGTS